VYAVPGGGGGSGVGVGDGGGGGGGVNGKAVESWRATVTWMEKLVMYITYNVTFRRVLSTIVAVAKQ
jgi:hypothetical protein